MSEKEKMCMNQRKAKHQFQICNEGKSRDQLLIFTKNMLRLTS